MQNYKKSVLRVVIAALTTVVAVCVLFLNNPPKKQLSIDDYTNFFMETTEGEFIGFISNFQIVKYSKPSFYLDIIEWLTLNDIERLKELNIDPDKDMPNGFYIHNPDNSYMLFQTAEGAQYSIIDWSEGVTHKSVSIEEFKDYLERYNSDFAPLFRVVIKDGYVQSITEQYVP